MQLLNRRVTDTIRLREIQLEISLLEARLDTLQALLDRGQRQTRVQELEQAKQRHAAAQEQLHRSAGSIQELRQSLQQVERDLQLPHYQQADSEYRRLVIEKRTRLIAIEDLDKYYLAVDRYGWMPWPAVRHGGWARSTA